MRDEFVRPIVAGAAATLPVAIMLSKRATDALALVLLFASLLACWAPARTGWRLGPIDRLWIALLTTPLVLTAAQVVVGLTPWSDAFETPLRYTCGIPVLLAARRLQLSPRTIGYGCLAGLATGVIAAAWMLVGVLSAGIPEDAARVVSPNGYFGIIPYSALCATYGFIAAALIASLHPPGRRARPLMVLALAAGFSVGLISATRSSWLLIGLVGLVVLNMPTLFTLRQRWGLLLGGLAVAAVLFVAVTPLRERLFLAGQQVEGYYGGGPFVSTSVGERLALWQFAAKSIIEHPVLGIGPNRFRAAVEEAKAGGVLPPTLTTHPHPHDETLLFGVRYGVLGIVLLGLFYLTPMVAFARACRNRAEALRGLPLFVLPLAFLAGGLTDVMLFWDVTITFYVMVVSYLMGAVGVVGALSRGDRVSGDRAHDRAGVGTPAAVKSADG